MGSDEKRPLIFVEAGRGAEEDDADVMSPSSEMDSAALNATFDEKPTSAATKIRVSFLGNTLDRLSKVLEFI